MTVFSRQDGTIVLNKNHPGYIAFKDFTLSYLQLEDSEREKLDPPEGIKKVAAVIDRAIKQRRIAEVFDILRYSYTGEALMKLYRVYSGNMVQEVLVCVRCLIMA